MLTLRVMTKLDNWWTSLKVPEKERIAGKIAGTPVNYPECTRVWNSLSAERQQKIHDHCVDKHGLLTPEVFDGNPFTD